jgi:hypothetical protein
MRAIEDSSDTNQLAPSMRQFLEWVSARERTYDETMDAWRTSCPRLSVWEDASIAGYVVLVRVDERGDVVRVTELGRTLLDQPK